MDFTLLWRSRCVSKIPYCYLAYFFLVCDTISKVAFFHKFRPNLYVYSEGTLLSYVVFTDGEWDVVWKYDAVSNQIIPQQDKKFHWKSM